MMSNARKLAEVALNEVSDSIRSRRVMVLLALYMAGSAAATLLFISFLRNIEAQLMKSLGLPESANAGSVTRQLWKSEVFRGTVAHMVRDRELADRLLSIPPLGLFYGWLSATFSPLLVILTASVRISEEIWTGSARFVLFRCPRLTWVIGKTAGQAGQMLIALLLSACAAWVSAWLRLKAFDAGPTAWAMMLFAFKAWVYSLAFVGLAIGVSQIFSSPNVATAVGFITLFGMGVVHGIAAHARQPILKETAQTIELLLPGGHMMDAVWRFDLPHFISGCAFSIALGIFYLGLGYMFFSRRDM